MYIFIFSLEGYESINVLREAGPKCHSVVGYNMMEAVGLLEKVARRVKPFQSHSSYRCLSFQKLFLLQLCFLCFGYQEHKERRKEQPFSELLLCANIRLGQWQLLSFEDISLTLSTVLR